jgi:hypothetical protein
VTVSALGVGRCIPFTVYNHCISLGILQLHRHRYSLSKSTEFVNFMNELDVWLLDRVCFLTRVHVLVYPPRAFAFVVEVGCNHIASGP